VEFEVGGGREACLEAGLTISGINAEVSLTFFEWSLTFDFARAAARVV
jgi:hypothetical protein